MTTTVRARELRSSRAAASVFVRTPSARVLGGAFAVLATARVASGRPSRRDAAAAGVVSVARPFVEWGIHRFVLHAPARTVAGRTVDTAAGHRAHHGDPDDVELALLPGPYAAAYAATLASLAAGTAVVAGVAERRWRGRGVPGPDAGTVGRTALSAATAATASLAAYEWVHLLVHTAVRPRTRVLRDLKRHHRLHHFRNERYWLGITGTAGDRLLRTRPHRGDVPLSPTARTLAGANP